MKIYKIFIICFLLFVLQSCIDERNNLSYWYEYKMQEELANWKDTTLKKESETLSAKDLHNLGVVTYEFWKDSQDTLSLLKETETYFLESLGKRENTDTRYNLEQIQKLLKDYTQVEEQEKNERKNETKNEQKGEEDTAGKENNGEKQTTGEESPEKGENEDSKEKTSGEQGASSSEETGSGDTSENPKDTTAGAGEQNGVTQSPRDEKYMSQEGEQKEQLGEGEIKQLENIAEKLSQEQEYYQQFFGKNEAEKGGDIFEQFFGSQGGIFGDIKTEKEKDW